MDVDEQDQLDELQDKLLADEAEHEKDKMRVENTSIYTVRQEIIKRGEQAKRKDD